MATGTIILSVPPNGFDGTNPAGLDYENDVPKILFDDATSEICYWQFRMPENYASALVMKMIYTMESANSGTITLEISIWAASDNESAIAASYDTANSVAEAVPGTAGFTSDLSKALTNDDSVTANDLVRVKVARNVGVLVAGDLAIRALSLEYTTT